MPEKQSSVLRPPTQVLTRGFDPSLSVGSARPAVFRSSTYVFSSPEAAERAFDLMAGRAQPTPDEKPDLVYSRFNHPNAEILEDQIVPLETGAHAARSEEHTSELQSHVNLVCRLLLEKKKNNRHC